MYLIDCLYLCLCYLVACKFGCLIVYCLLVWLCESLIDCLIVRCRVDVFVLSFILLCSCMCFVCVRFVCVFVCIFDLMVDAWIVWLRECVCAICV